MSGAAAGSTPKNSGGVTPTTVNGRLLIRIGWPAALAALPETPLTEPVADHGHRRRSRPVVVGG